MIKEEDNSAYKGEESETIQMGILEWEKEKEIEQYESNQSEKEFFEENSIRASKLGQGACFFIKSQDESYMAGGGYFQSYDIIKGKYVDLQGFYVKPEYRRKGLMSKIYNAIEEDLLKNDMKVVSLNCSEGNKVALSFYQKFGIVKQFDTFDYPKIPYKQIQKDFDEYEKQRREIYEGFLKKNEKIFENKLGMELVKADDPSCKSIPDSTELLNYTNIFDYVEISEKKIFDDFFKIKNSDENLGKSVDIYWILDPDNFPLGFFCLNYLPHYYFGLDLAHCRYLFINNEVIQLKDEILEYVVCNVVKISVEEKNCACLSFEVREGQYDEDVDGVMSEIGILKGNSPVCMKEL